MTRQETAELLRAGGGLLARAGISQSTVARALGLHPSQVSLWLNRRPDGFTKMMTDRQARFLRVLANLRRAETHQAAAEVLAGCDNRRYAPQAWHLDDAGRVRFGPPKDSDGLGPVRERRPRVLL